MDNDGTYDHTGVLPTHDYDYGTWGEKTCTVRITDDDGMTDTATASYTLLEPPNADLVGGASTSGDYYILWDASASTDADGTIVQYEWDVDNDGTYDHTGAVPTHDYDYGTWGEQTCVVRVTDNDGLTDTATASFRLLEPPNADLQGTAGWQTMPPYYPYVDWDASGSTDADGTIVLYEWDLDDDGTFETDTGTTPTAQGVYPGPGNDATATVRVTDNDGLTDTATLTVPFSTLEYPPTAVLTGEYLGDLTVHWDASGSFDSDGTIVLYEYDFEDDGTWDYSSATETEQWHTYPSEGDVTCRLRVTDNDGLTDETTYTVSIFIPT